MTDNFKQVIEELQKYKVEDKSTVLATAIQNRLNQSLQTYYHELSSTVTNLSSKSAIRVYKEIAK